MKKLVGLFGLLALFTVVTMAQDQPQDQTKDQAQDQTKDQAKVKPARKAPRIEVSGGAAIRSFYFLDGATGGMYGWYLSGDYNFKRWLGAAVEGAGTYRNMGIDGNGSLYTLLVGPRLYPLGHRKLTAYGQVLFGAGYYRNIIPANVGFPRTPQTYASSAWEAGGGVNLNLRKRLGITLFELDYGHTNFFGSGTPKQGNVRASVGIVYRFGER